MGNAAGAEISTFFPLDTCVRVPDSKKRLPDRSCLVIVITPLQFAEEINSELEIKLPAAATNGMFIV